MRAAIQAQGEAAKATVEFIKAVGFEEPSSTTETSNMDAGKVRNVVFQYTRKDASGASSDAKLEVPILTIVPIPFIRIEEMTIDFTAKITETIEAKSDSADKSDKSVSVAAGGSGGMGFWKASVDFKASYSASHTSSEQRSSKYNVEFTVNVHVRAVQDSLPAGLSRILGILEANIKEPLPAKA
ncbi:MAG: DUF2589 domain-containing protein [Nitrospinae bacterium]|nr:DUF2589 domain-containing protein [Nitrospinota bacterium]